MLLIAGMVYTDVPEKCGRGQQVRQTHGLLCGSSSAVPTKCSTDHERVRLM